MNYDNLPTDDLKEFGIIGGPRLPDDEGIPEIFS